MKLVLVAVASLLIANHATARLGETQEQAAERYGAPVFTKTERVYGTPELLYKKGGITILATYFTNTHGVSVIGKIRFWMSPVLSNDEAKSGTLIKQLLEANAEGKQWIDDSTGIYRRPGAHAIRASNFLIITADEYVDFTKAEAKKRAIGPYKEAEQSIGDF